MQREINKEYNGLKIFTSVKSNDDWNWDRNINSNDAKYIIKSDFNKLKVEDMSKVTMKRIGYQSWTNFSQFGYPWVKRDVGLQQNLTIYSQIRWSVKKVIYSLIYSIDQLQRKTDKAHEKNTK